MLSTCKGEEKHLERSTRLSIHEIGNNSFENGLLNRIDHTNFIRLFPITNNEAHTYGINVLEYI